ncbi:adenine phosphoribosyltransferase [Orenia metallireducens]|uniref:Adenine phosphoribosyltransferase n=1 Tax=Orenia metallireducens TaxID=1413210 RepID=A0A285G8N9_9FIRM|nr:adenine phosphoribosyltransferase [Orenia metallireducens]PRX24212.1 adenine phosphoribosyltransferase [Orenia metallireducens]SNY19778.1 adenine phosphoribosyltransferase [Orenia metallireducens]
MNLADKIRTIPDFPKEGIAFKDITTLLKDPAAYKEAINRIAKRYEDKDIDLVLGIEARGFLIGAPLALKLDKGFVPVRKEGKLPGDVVKTEYDLEYGSNIIEIHKDAIEQGAKILIVDDLLATGGTVKATVDLVEQLGGEVVEIAFLMELGFLDGREKIGDYEVFSLIIDE